jgi:two-component system, chemotaxis family, protein-glutamate methylesterase/glutaminase
VHDGAVSKEAFVDELVRVLVVDDSAYVRKVLKQMLSRSPFLEVVGTARNGAEALEMVAELRPDVVTLDLVMPGMDGEAFLREQMARRPVPVVIVSVADANGERMLRALEAGAVDMVQKPTALATDKVFEIANELIAKVKAAAEARWPARLSALSALPAHAPAVAPREYAGAFDVIVLGVSTGGPQALRFLIPQLPADLPVPIALVLHMPAGYTEMYARGLNEISRLKVIEAREGDPLRPGVVLIAPAGQHLTFRRLPGEGVVAHLDMNPMGMPHRPAVDVLFRSAAEVFGSRVLGVVLSGMGADGTDGAAWIKAQGGTIFTESEETCVVYGMPRSVDEAGLSDRSMPLSAVASAILEAL